MSSISRVAQQGYDDNEQLVGVLPRLDEFNLVVFARFQVANTNDQMIWNNDGQGTQVLLTVYKYTLNPFKSKGVGGLYFCGPVGYNSGKGAQMGKRGFQPGTMIRDQEWRDNLREANRKSRKQRQHLMRLHASLIGKKLPATAQAGSAASLRLRAMGLSREDAPELWSRYAEFYLRRQQAIAAV